MTMEAAEPRLRMASTISRHLAAGVQSSAPPMSTSSGRTTYSLTREKQPPGETPRPVHRPRRVDPPLGPADGRHLVGNHEGPGLEVAQGAEGIVEARRGRRL